MDNFAGGGGASTGIEMATGISVDIAINHDPEAVRMHKANHPETRHYCEDVWMIDPVKVCAGRPVALAWFSPDCKHFSRAKGGKPKDKNIRGLAWVACRWAGLVRPDVIMLENVPEFQTWGPLGRRKHPIRPKKGNTYRKFISQLENLGYKVESRELIAADYGAPTMRRRFFMIARCDGRPIVWPQPTHGPAESDAVKSGMLKAYNGADTQIDFSLPCPSIFDTSEEIREKYGIRAVRPLAEKTMSRIARGLKKYVIDSADPFIIPIGYGEREGQKPRIHSTKEPLPTIVGNAKHYLCEPYMIQIGQTGFAKHRSKDVREPLATVVSKNEHCMINAELMPYIMYNNENNTGAGIRDPLPTITTGNRNFLATPILIQYHGETNATEIRGQHISEPIMTVDTSNRYGLATAFLHKYFGGGYAGAGSHLETPLPTITARDHNSICTAYLTQLNNHCDGSNIEDPLPSVTAGGNHFAEVRAFLIKYYGQGTGQDIREPLDTIPTHDRFGLVTICGTQYQIVDIGLRMLEPKELYGCQGFPPDYIIDHDCDGKSYPRSEQVRRCGNAVCPPVPEALVRANLPEMCRCKRTGNMRIDTESEQIRFVV